MTEIYLDVETEKLADEVPGGWNNIRALGLSVAVTWDVAHDFRNWFADDVQRLLDELARFDRIVTFNGNRFDLQVLSAYGRVTALRARSLDVLEYLKRCLGFRVSLESLARATLGTAKKGSGLDAVRWWRSGDPALRQRVVEHCRKDVELLRDIVAHARQQGSVRVPSHGKTIELVVTWDE